MEWQPIKTAPKRGLILAYAPERIDEDEDNDILPWLNYYGGYYVIVYWNRQDENWDDGGYGYDPDFFTHWLPVPKRPKENTEWPTDSKLHQLKRGLLKVKSLLLSGK